MTGWQDTKVTEPPMTMHLSDADVTDIRTGKFFVHEKFPNHTQAVERVIKLVTETSLAVCDSDHRDG